jgi:hypothetical protein
MHSTTRAAAVAAILLIPLAVSSPAHPARGLDLVQAAPSYTYVGTVHAVNARGGSLDLITGVGMALRLVHIPTQPTTLFAGAGAALRLGALQPGDIVRAECRTTPAGLVASRIEKIEAQKP